MGGKRKIFFKADQIFSKNVYEIFLLSIWSWAYVRMHSIVLKSLKINKCASMYIF